VLGLKGRANFEGRYPKPTVAGDLIEMTILDKPRSSKQKYRLTEKGRQVLKDVERAPEYNIRVVLDSWNTTQAAYGLVDDLVVLRKT